MKSEVGVVILNYSSYSDTIALVEALQKQSVAPSLSIVVVDNASPNESYRRLKPLEGRLANVTVIKTAENLGYAKGNNFGLRYIEENIGAKYVAILNNDVILPDDSFEQMIQRYEELESPAIIAPLMVDRDGEISTPWRINSYGDDLKSLFVLSRMLSKSGGYKDITSKRAMKVDVIPGSYMFMKLERFKRMGYFYPNTFLYAEERFVHHAARSLGLNNYIILDQSYIHAHNSPTISTYHNQYSKYRMLYDSWLEFTKVCRSNGAIKRAIMRPLMEYSLLEWRVIWWLKSKIRG